MVRVQKNVSKRHSTNTQWRILTTGQEFINNGLNILGFIKTTDPRPTDYHPNDPSTTYHLPTDSATTFPPTYIQLKDHLLSKCCEQITEN